METTEREYVKHAGSVRAIRWMGHNREAVIAFGSKAMVINAYVTGKATIKSTKTGLSIDVFIGDWVLKLSDNDIYTTDDATFRHLYVIPGWGIKACPDGANWEG